MRENTRKIANEYRESLDFYYECYKEDLIRTLNPPVGEPPRGKEMLKRLKSISGALGAQIGKAGQRAKRSIVFDMLLIERKKGADITFHVAQHIGHQAAKSKFATAEIVNTFSTTGRTASKRTEITEDEVDEIIERIAPAVSALDDYLIEVRQILNSNLHLDEEYKYMKKEISRLINTPDINK